MDLNLSQSKSRYYNKTVGMGSHRILQFRRAFGLSPSMDVRQGDEKQTSPVSRANDDASISEQITLFSWIDVICMLELEFGGSSRISRPIWCYSHRGRLAGFT